VGRASAKRRPIILHIERLLQVSVAARFAGRNHSPDEDNPFGTNITRDEPHKTACVGTAASWPTFCHRCRSPNDTPVPCHPANACTPHPSSRSLHLQSPTDLLPEQLLNQTMTPPRSPNTHANIRALMSTLCYQGPRCFSKPTGKKIKMGSTTLRNTNTDVGSGHPQSSIPRVLSTPHPRSKNLHKSSAWNSHSVHETPSLLPRFLLLLGMKALSMNGATAMWVPLDAEDNTEHDT